MTAATSLRASADGLSLGLRGPRGDVLVELKRSERLTAKELSVRLGLSLNAIRHHLRELEAGGLLASDRVPQGVGAPAFVYRLSAAGEALFPRRYEETLTQLLEHVAEEQGRGAAVRMLEAHFERLKARLRLELADAPPAERLRRVAVALSQAGYMAEARPDGDGATLVEHNCAIRAVAEKFPEICAAEARFLAEMVGASVERVAHMIGGDCACAYRIRFEGPAVAGPVTLAGVPQAGRAQHEENA